MYVLLMNLLEEKGISYDLWRRITSGRRKSTDWRRRVSTADKYLGKGGPGISIGSVTVDRRNE